MVTLDELLQDEELTYDEIALMLKVSKSTIYLRAKEKGIVRKVGAKKLNLDSIYENKIRKK